MPWIANREGSAALSMNVLRRDTLFKLMTEVLTRNGDRSEMNYPQHAYV